MNYRLLYAELSLNRMRRMDFQINTYIDKAEKMPKRIREMIEYKYRKFRNLKRDVTVLIGAQWVLYILIYISFISLFTAQFPILSFIATKIAVISSLIGIPILVVITGIIMRARNVIVSDAHVLVSEIIAVVTVYEHRQKVS